MKKHEFMNSARKLNELIKELEKIRDAYIKVALSNEDIRFDVIGDFKILEVDEHYFISGCEGCPIRYMNKISFDGGEIGEI